MYGTRVFPRRGWIFVAGIRKEVMSFSGIFDALDQIDIHGAEHI